MDKERDCENCVHYVANYELPLKTCEKWNCQFEPDEEGTTIDERTDNPK